VFFLRSVVVAQPQKFDAIVVGGGPAGLIGATYLARFRRSCLVVDADRSRVAKIPRSHNYPGVAEGITGPKLLASLRRQVAAYPIERMSGAVEAIERDGDAFRVHWPGGEAVASAVLLSTGATDVEPAMAHLAEALREGALRYCPVCDGYEVVDQAVGVIGAGPAGIAEALYLRHFTNRLTLFLDGAELEMSDRDRKRLADAGITWQAEPIRSLRLWKQRVTVSHGEAETVCDSVYCALGMRVHSDLAMRLGAEADDQGYLFTDAHQRTTVPGLYAAGDVASGLNQITVAAGGAAIAASAIHQLLRSSSADAT